MESGDLNINLLARYAGMIYFWQLAISSTVTYTSFAMFLCPLAGFSHVCHKPQGTKAIYRSKGFPWFYRFDYWCRGGKSSVHANIIYCLCFLEAIHLI